MCVECLGFGGGRGRGLALQLSGHSVVFGLREGNWGRGAKGGGPAGRTLATRGRDNLKPRQGGNRGTEEKDAVWGDGGGGGSELC